MVASFTLWLGSSFIPSFNKLTFFLLTENANLCIAHFTIHNAYFEYSFLSAGKLITKDEGLRQLMKTVPSVFVASIDHPIPGTWTLEVSTEISEKESGDDNKQLQWHSVRVSGISEVDFVPGFATNPLPYNVGSSRRPISGKVFNTMKLIHIITPPFWPQHLCTLSYTVWP